MTRLLSRCIFLSIVILLLGHVSCQKDKTTTVNGTVVDKVTGEPLDSVLINFRIKVNNDAFQDDFVSIYSDINGEFSFSHEKPFSLFTLEKKGYLLKGPGAEFPTINYGKTNEVIVNMIPRDGLLKLLLHNPGQFADTVYVYIYSPQQQAEYEMTYGVIINYPFFVQGFSSQSRTFNLASDETVDIYWGPNQLASSQIMSAPNHSSIYINKADTANVSINL